METERNLKYSRGLNREQILSTARRAIDWKFLADNGNHLIGKPVDASGKPIENGEVLFIRTNESLEPFRISVFGKSKNDTNSISIRLGDEGFGHEAVGELWSTATKPIEPDRASIEADQRRRMQERTDALEAETQRFEKEALEPFLRT